MLQVLWFKRDLRLYDHPALWEAAKYGAILPIYILEPALWQQIEMSKRQYLFLQDCLIELDLALKKQNAQLNFYIGDVEGTLETLFQKFGTFTLWSHQETWSYWSYERDKRVKDWANTRAIAWVEPRQNGVFRGSTNRDDWALNCSKEMNKTPLKKFYTQSWVKDENALTLHQFPKAEELGLQSLGELNLPKGGRKEAISLLTSFLLQRGHKYTYQMSSPVTAYHASSRLSPHFAFGTISIREAYYAVKKARAKNAFYDTSWARAYRSFEGRLHWNWHFIQKLEDEPEIEFKNMHPSYDGLIRDDDVKKYTSWISGQTGFPMVDASMRALIQTGWLNFRMRAMVMSFASYHLWLDWRMTSKGLAQLFTDFEPSIHYSQAQMQSGTTGINSIRIYNPIKQSQDQDPKAIFIRKYIPEIAHLPNDIIHTPWKAHNVNLKYPHPSIDETVARKEAASKIFEIRKSAIHKTEAKQVFTKHGSRKKPRRRSASHIKDKAQGDLFS